MEAAESVAFVLVCASAATATTPTITAMTASRMIVVVNRMLYRVEKRNSVTV